MKLALSFVLPCVSFVAFAAIAAAQAVQSPLRGPSPVDGAPQQPHAAAEKVPAHAPALSTIDPFLDPDRVSIDCPEGSDYWISADRYKAACRTGSFVFVPFLGSMAPQNYPVEFRLASVSVGGEALAVSHAVAPRRDGDRIVYEHGTFVERYEASKDGVEQSFLFSSLPRRGELRVRIDVDSSLPFADDGADIAFANERGGVHYGSAHAVDAGGRKVEVPRHRIPGGIEIVVPASVVETATLPLLVDPLIAGSATLVHTQTDNKPLVNTDIAYDASSNLYMVCYELVFSATDSDVFAYEMLANGGLFGAQRIVDTTTTSWQAPRIANNNLANRYLVVAQTSTGNASPFLIRGRTMDAAAPTSGNQFAIAVPGVDDPGDKIRPDVCGDPSLSGTTRFRVVWESAYSPTDHDVYVRVLSSDLNPTSVAYVAIDTTTAYDEYPAISDSMGAPIPDASVQRAMVVWKRRQGVNADIVARTIAASGVLGSTFTVAGGATPKSLPAVSSVTQPIGVGNYLYLVAFEQGNTGARDIMIALCAQPGQVVGPAISLHSIETDPFLPAFATWDQFVPRVATDGVRFAVTYGEGYNNSSDLDCRVSTVHAVAAWTLGVTESRVWAASNTSVEKQMRIASRYDGAAANANAAAGRRFGLAWIDEAGVNPDVVRAALYDGVASAGGFGYSASGCGGVTISASGVPALGEFVSITTTGASLLAFGTPIVPSSIAGCPSACRIGVSLPAVLPFTSIGMQIPPNAALIGESYAFQAFSLLGGPCFGFLSASDTVTMTIQ